MKSAVEIQREYYAQTAGSYNQWHTASGQDPEHQFALHILDSFIRPLRITSVLDVGAGTGRTMLYFRDQFPDVRITGLEPASEMRDIAIANSIPESDIQGGDGAAMEYEDGAFDLVCSFGVLHHVTDPAAVVSEMLRVANKGIFISDNNHVGQGSSISRLLKRMLRSTRLFPLAEWVLTRGRGYRFSNDDGVYYFYTLFDNLPSIQQQCQATHIFNTAKMIGFDLYRGASHIGVLGIK